MMGDLRAQVGFVRQVAEVDTEGVEPLVVVRDEGEERVVGLEEMRGESGREEVVGLWGRIVRRGGGGDGGGGGGVDLLAQAPRRLGRYVVVDTAKD